MNDTLKEIIRILEGGEPELQVAAAQILGELGPKDPAVGRALVVCLDRGEAFLHRFVLEALAKIRTPNAVRALVSRLSEGGADQDLVIHLLGELGTAAHKPLAALFPEAGQETRKQILRLLGRQVSREGLAVVLKALVLPELTREAGRALVGQAGELTDAQRRSVKEVCNKLLGAKTAEVPSECLPEILVVLGRIDGSGARTTLLRFCSDRHPTDVRRAALRGLAGVKLTPGQVQSLLAILMDSGSRPLEAPIMSLLEGIESWDADSLPNFKKLLRSKRPEQALFALRSLRCFLDPDVAKEALRFLDHSNPEFRQAAAEVLGGNPSAVDPLLRVLQTEKDPDRARVISGILARHRERFPAKQLKSLVEKVCKQLGAQDPMGEVRLQLLLEIDGSKAGELMVDKAVRLRRARRLAECLTILAHLARSAYLPDEGRYQMAVARLLLDENGTRAETARAGDATMGYIARLVRDGFPVLERLKKEAMVPPKAKLRVGTHFADAVGAERRFGTELLHHVADKHSRDRVGEEARLMLRAEGL